MIPYGRQEIDSEDVEAVLKTLRSDWLTQGPSVPEFERLISNYCQAKHAIATNSATSALHIACLALGVKKGDKIWTSPISFVASANCALYCGADVDFVDVSSTTYNLCPELLEKKLIQAEKSGDLPQVLIPVHLAGQSCDMSKIYELSQRYSFRIIEDASHAIGGQYRESPIGGCRFSDITVFSFHPVKIITTGEGGMALTNSKKLADKLRLLRSHGIVKDQSLMRGPVDGPWYYEQTSLGYNFRMTDLQASLGISQSNRLDSIIDRRRCIARNYDRELEALPLITPAQSQDCLSSWHLYIVKLKLDEISSTKKEIFEFMREQGIGVSLHYIPIYKHPFYRSLGLSDKDFSNSAEYYREAMTIPIYPNMTEDQQAQVIAALKSSIYS
jgi:UDP-4-amino-4,6-dideoxy-N-acetyl-beta-L-altrosamine transaminase